MAKHIVDKTVQTRREELYGLLGDLPNRNRPISVSVVKQQETKSFFIERLLLDLNGLERVPAYFVKPLGQKGRRPTVLYNHAHGSNFELGKDELINGRRELQNPPYASELTEHGYAALCIDSWAFNERGDRPESIIFKEMILKGRVLWGMMVFDSLRALDYLVSRNDVDPDRIATLGLSMGSTMAWWVAALDERIKVCVDMCCLGDYEALIETGGIDKHRLYYFVPGIMNHFTTAQINALIAPRPHLALAGKYDLLTPPVGLDRINKELKRVYAETGNPEAWKLVTYECGHMETAAMRAEVMKFLAQWL